MMELSVCLLLSQGIRWTISPFSPPFHFLFTPLYPAPRAALALKSEKGEKEITKSTKKKK
jgi:hypothetical protein